MRKKAQEDLHNVASGFFRRFFPRVATPYKNDNNSSFNKRCITERKKGPVTDHSLSSLKGYD